MTKVFEHSVIQDPGRRNKVFIRRISGFNSEILDQQVSVNAVLRCSFVVEIPLDFGGQGNFFSHVKPRL